jgi:hypothetical protein
VKTIESDLDEGGAWMPDSTVVTVVHGSRKHPVRPSLLFSQVQPPYPRQLSISTE